MNHQRTESRMRDQNFTDQELQVIQRAESALACGLELKRWWQQASENHSYPNPYRQAFVFNRPDDFSCGFYGEAKVGGRRLPINGNVQHMFYDAPKASERGGSQAQWMQSQIREFVLRYFLRVSDYRQPQQVVAPVRESTRPLFDFFSQCPKGDPQLEGFGFTQLFFKLKETGEILRFPRDQRLAIIDLHEVGRKYEWIVLRNPIFNFDLRLSPFGNNGPQFVLPLPEANYLVISKDFVVDEDRPDVGLLGRYGIGYAFINAPGPPGVFAYGPGQLEPAFEQLNWEVNENGEVMAKFVFVARQPERILNISLNPLQWGGTISKLLRFKTGARILQPFADALMLAPLLNSTFDPVFTSVRLLNLITANQAAQQLCISRVQIIKELLFVHFLQHYQTAVGSIQTWRQISDWLDEDALPDWVKTGVSS